MKDLKKREGVGFEQNSYLYASALVTGTKRVGGGSKEAGHRFWPMPSWEFIAYILYL